MEITSDDLSDLKKKLALHLASHVNFLMKKLPPTSEPASKVGFTNQLYARVLFIFVSSLSEQCLALSRYLAELSWPKKSTEMCSGSNLQKHFFMLGVIRIIGFSAQFFHICDKVSVANNLQKASLKRDSQPKVFKNRRNACEEKQNIYFGICSLDVCTIELSIFI